MDVRECFNTWRQNASFARYDRLCVEQFEVIEDTVKSVWDFYIPIDK
jgi:hypothetical protein